MLDLSLLSPEPIPKPETKAKKPERPITAEQQWQRAHGIWRDGIVSELYADTGLIGSISYATIDSVHPGWSGVTTSEGALEMALNLTSLKVSDVELEKGSRGRAKRDLGPALDWVKESFTKKTGKQIPVSGSFVSRTTKPREGSNHKATTVIVPSGDAAELAGILRSAAEEMNYGLSVQYVNGKNVVKLSDAKVGDKITAVRFQAQVKQERNRDDDDK